MNPLTQPRRSDVIERWRHVYEKHSPMARFRAWLALRGHVDEPSRPKWVVHSWYALLGLAILVVLIMYVLVVREIVK